MRIQLLSFRGNKAEFMAYLAGMRSGKVVDLAWYRVNRDKKKAASRAADEITSNPSIA